MKSSFHYFVGIENLPSQFIEEIQSFNISVVRSHLVNVPAAFGLFKAYLILPSNFCDLSITTQSVILKHEMYHLRRADHKLNVLRFLIKSIFWFNSLVFIADKVCEADQEIGVLLNSSAGVKRQYANVLVEYASIDNQTQLISQWKFQSLIKERVKMLKYSNVKPSHKWVTLTFSVFAILMTNGVVLAGHGKNLKEPIPSITVVPMYPKNAELEGVSGWVKFKFDIDRFGHLYNIEIVEANPKKVFESDEKKQLKTGNLITIKVKREYIIQWSLL